MPEDILGKEEGHLHHPEAPSQPGKIPGEVEKGERHFATEGERNYLIGEISGKKEQERAQELVDKFYTAKTVDEKRETLKSLRNLGKGKRTKTKENIENLSAALRAELSGEVPPGEPYLERKEKREPPTRGEPVAYKESPIPKWVEARLKEEFEKIPKVKGKTSYETAEKLIQDYRDTLNKKEAMNQPYKPADYTEFNRFRDEIHGFLADPGKSEEERARVLWLRYEGEARIRLQEYWQEGWYGLEGIGKRAAVVKDKSRWLLIEHYAAILTIPEVVKGMTQRKGYITETDLYGHERVGYHLRRLGLTCMFKDVAAEDRRGEQILKEFPGTKVFKIQEGKDHEFCPYRVLHMMAWANAFHKPEEWCRMLEPIGQDEKGNVIYKDHSQLGFTYDMWHDPGKARFYVTNWERLGTSNQEELIWDVKKEEKEALENQIKELGNYYLTHPGEDAKDKDLEKKIGEILRRNLIRLCGDPDKAIKLEEIQWQEIFSDYSNFMHKRRPLLADDLLTNYLVNFNYMETSQEILMGENGYLLQISPDFKMVKEIADKGFQHLGDLKELILEADYWYKDCSDAFYSLFERARAAGRREVLGQEINAAIVMGMDMDFYRKHIFEACGIIDPETGVALKNWTNLRENPLTPQEKIRIILQHLPNPEIWGKGLFGKKGKYGGLGISFEELIAFAGWKLENGRIISLEEAFPKGATEEEKKNIKEDFKKWKEQHLDEDKERVIMELLKAEGLFQIFDKRHLDRIIDTAAEWYIDLAIREGRLDDLRRELGIEIENKTWKKIKENLPKLRYWGLIDTLTEDVYFFNNFIRPFSRFFRERLLGQVLPRRWGPQFDLWNREKLFWLVKRKAMKYAVGEGIKDRPILEQLDWDKLKDEGAWALKERPTSNERGAERIANVVMGSGELLAGSIDRLTPIYLYYDRTRYLYGLLAPWSLGFWEEAADNLGLDWNERKIWRLVMTPEKHALVLTLIRNAGWISEKEREGWEILLGCEMNTQAREFTNNRRGFLIPDIEGKITPEAVAEGAAKLTETAAAMAPPAMGPIGAIFRLLPIPRSSKELVSIGRASLGLGTAAFLATTGTFNILWAPVAAAAFGAYWGKDWGDDVRGLLSSQGYLGLRGGRIGPIYLGREGKRQIEAIRSSPDPLWDDVVSAEAIFKAFEEARERLGDQATLK